MKARAVAYITDRPGRALGVHTGPRVSGSEMFGRAVMMTTLDPVPRQLRACARHVVLNQREVDAVNAELNSKTRGVVFGQIVAILQAEDELEAAQQRPRRKRGRHGR